MADNKLSRYGSRGEEDIAAAISRISEPVRVSMTDHPGRVGSRERRDAQASGLFDDGLEALRAATELSMTTAEYRMGLQRANRLFVAARELTTGGPRRSELDRLIESLEGNLEIDWRHVRDVEVRYRDGSIELINVKVDPEAARKFQAAIAFRFVGMA